MLIALVLIIVAIALFGLGAVVEGALWLVAVGAIVLIASIAFAIGQLRSR